MESTAWNAFSHSDIQGDIRNTPPKYLYMPSNLLLGTCLKPSKCLRCKARMNLGDNRGSSRRMWG